MATSTDILLQDNDLVIVHGDLTTGPSDAQHIEDTINAFPGWWKENPADGVGIFQYINSSGKEQEISRNIVITLQSDGYQANSPSVSVNNKGTLTIIPNATKL
jgi:hypothetical protein